MKTQIRRSIFETNSSSVHSITMVSGSEYDKWKNGELLYYKDTENLVTKEEIEKIKEDDKKIYESHGWTFDESKYDCNSSNCRFLTCDKFFNWHGDWPDVEYETFIDHYKTKDGEEVVAFGFYGHD